MHFQQPSLTVQRPDLAKGKNTDREVGELTVAVVPPRNEEEDLGRQRPRGRREGETLRWDFSQRNRLV